MTNLEHIIENTLDAFSEGHPAERILGFIKTDMNFPEQPLTVEQIYEICQYVWCTYLDFGRLLKKEVETDFEVAREADAPRSRKERIQEVLREFCNQRATSVEITYAEGEFPNVTRAQEVFRQEARHIVRSIELEQRLPLKERVRTAIVKERPRTVLLRFDWSGINYESQNKTR